MGRGKRAYRLSFRIRRTYFDQIVSGEKTFEVRRATDYWRIRAARAREALGSGFRPSRAIAAFVSGRLVHRREILGVDEFESAEAALGRLPSVQGMWDLGEGRVVRFRLGRVIRNTACAFCGADDHDSGHCPGGE
jgi:hypothetical protein